MSATEYAKNLPIRTNMTSGMNRILSFPRCRIAAETTATTLLGTGATAVIKFDTTRIDTDGMASLSTETIIIRTAGSYELIAELGIPVPNPIACTHVMYFALGLSGVNVIEGYLQRTVPAGAGTQYYSITAREEFNAGDTVAVVASQNTGTDGNTPLSSTSNRFGAELSVTCTSTP